MAAPWRRSLLRGVAGGVGTAVLGAAFLAGLAAKERDNRFCVACHLHEAKFERMVGLPAGDLAGSHHASDARVGCIACHGGSDAVMRVRVWAGAGFDTLRFLAGVYAEPTSMRLPLRDRECRQCHTPIVRVSRTTGATGPPAPADTTPDWGAGYLAEAPTVGDGGISYHGFRQHDGVDVRCVACHTAHTTDSSPGEQFLSKRVVEPVCQRCHRER
jgi:predicted CXXCH cytochrome family protein